MTRRPPRSTRTDTLFPYTTLFRSLGNELPHRSAAAGQAVVLADEEPQPVHLVLVQLDGERLAVLSAARQAQHHEGAVGHPIPQMVLQLSRIGHDRLLIYGTGYTNGRREGSAMLDGMKPIGRPGVVHP